MADELLSDYRREVTDLKRERDDLKKALDKREGENKTFRDTVKTLETERDTLKTQLPPEGSLVLNKADSERYNVYKGLGTVDEVTAKVNGYGDLETKEKSRARADGIKANGFKPSIFELIAEGNDYRVDGEGDDRKVFVTVDDKEQELTAYAAERDLSDLLGVMGLSVETPKPVPPTFTGAGTRKAGEFKVLTTEERAKQKENESRYSGL